MRRIWGIIKKDTVLMIAWILAVLSCFFVKPSFEYFEYIDYNYYLDIQLRDDGVPISAKYNKKETIYSLGNILYAKEN